MAGRTRAVFNFEGGCYAKMIRLSPEAEPEIYATTQALRHRARERGDGPGDARARPRRPEPRREYPRRLSDRLHPQLLGREYGPGAEERRSSSTADAFGVLPPIARLTPEQAMYHFLSGYTAKVAGTEIGVTEPEATFSTCFGAPFMPRFPGSTATC